MSINKIYRGRGQSGTPEEVGNTGGGSTGGHIIVDSEGTAMPARTNLQFEGFNVADDETNNVTIVSPLAPTIKVYGFHQNFTDLNPDSTISYTIPNPQYDVINADYLPMMTNINNGTTTAGSWATFLSDVLHNKPAMVKTNGQVDYWLDPDDYTKKENGTASDYNNTSYAGGAFAWIDKIFIKEVYAADGQSRDVYFSFGEAPDDTFEPLGFHDNVSELEGLWLPMGYMDANGKTLITGTTPVASKTCEQEWTLIQGFSSRARFLGGPIINVLRDLEYMLFKSTDIQKTAGYGRCNAYSTEGQNKYNRVVNNGVVKGFYGNGDKVTNNKLFHSQVLGTYQQWLRDPYTLLINGTLYVSPNYIYNLNGVVNTGITRTSSSAWSYPGKMEKVEGFGSIGKGSDGSTITGLCDGHYYNASGTRVALRCGSSDGDLMDGPEALHLGAEATYAGWSVGDGVLLLPPAGYNPTA